MLTTYRYQEQENMNEKNICTVMTYYINSQGHIIKMQYREEGE